MPMLRNPALAGIFDGDIRVSIAHRNQWQSVTVPFKTSALGVEYKLPVFSYNDYLTLGAQIVYDVAGDVHLKRTQLLPVLNFHKSLSDDKDNYLSVAFTGGPVQSRFNPALARLDDQFIDGAFSAVNATQEFFTNTGFSYWDASAGITYSSGFGEASRYYIGAALFHFTQPPVHFFTDASDTYLSRKWSLNAGLTMATSEINRLLAYADYFTQGGNRQFLAGMIYETDITQNYDEDNVSLGIGGFYRYNDAVVPVVRLKYFKTEIGLSYDVNISSLATASRLRGGFELTGTFRGFLNTRNSSLEKTRCVH